MSLTSSEEMRMLIEQARLSWVTGDSASFAALFVPEGVLIVPGKRWVGRSRIEQAAAAYAATHVVESIVLQRVLVGDNQAAIEWSWRDKERGKATAQTAQDAIIVDFSAGQITQWREYIDAESA